jgi:hypothetical protein
MTKLFRLLLAITALSLCACGVDVDHETVAEQTAEVGSECFLFPWSDDAYSPIPGPGTNNGTRVEYRIANGGDLACTSQSQVEAYKNGVTYAGTVFSNASLAPTDFSASPATPTILRRQDFLNVSKPCQYQIWLKFRATPSSPNLWRSYGVTWC